jgi:hypothetical protein
MSEKRTTFPYIPEHALCFWKQDGQWVCAFSDYVQGEPCGIGVNFEEAFKNLTTNYREHVRSRIQPLD